ncbi:hypothetical protein FQA39_LY04412 [Lamprigera yunnana]|nr:hypothetical protein FQA39_LY04412 [Lamprigera yunnana]
MKRIWGVIEDLKTVSLSLEKINNKTLNRNYPLVHDKSIWKQNGKIKIGKCFLDNLAFPNQLCLGRAVFKNYFNKNDYAFMVKVFGTTTNDQIKIQKQICDIALMLPTDPNQHIEKEAKCSLWKENWQQSECKTVQEFVNKAVQCQCKNLGYYSLKLLTTRNINFTVTLQNTVHTTKTTEESIDKRLTTSTDRESLTTTVQSTEETKTFTQSSVLNGTEKIKGTTSKDSPATVKNSAKTEITNSAKSTEETKFTLITTIRTTAKTEPTTETVTTPKSTEETKLTVITTIKTTKPTTETITTEKSTGNSKFSTQITTAKDNHTTSKSTEKIELITTTSKDNFTTVTNTPKTEPTTAKCSENTKFSTETTTTKDSHTATESTENTKLTTKIIPTTKRNVTTTESIEKTKVPNIITTPVSTKSTETSTTTKDSLTTLENSETTTPTTQNHQTTIESTTTIKNNQITIKSTDGSAPTTADTHSNLTQTHDDAQISDTELILYYCIIGFSTCGAVLFGYGTKRVLSKEVEPLEGDDPKYEQLYNEELLQDVSEHAYPFS